MESHAGQSVIPPSSIMGVRNEHANISSKNQSGDWSIRKVKYQTRSHPSSKCTISEPHPGTLATNKIDSNANTCFLGKNFILMAMTYRTSDVYPYDTSYGPIIMFQ